MAAAGGERSAVRREMNRATDPSTGRIAQCFVPNPRITDEGIVAPGHP